jgi:glycosyltransferase 2 family protein
MNRSPWSLLSAAAGAAILGVVLWQTGTDPVVTGLRSLDAWTLALGAALAVPSTVACAWRWHIVSRELGVRVDVGPAVASCYRAQFLNTILPGGVLGDVHRGVRHGLDAEDTGRGMRAVAWERLAGQVVQAVIVIVVLLVIPSAALSAMPAVVGVLVLVVLAVVLVAQHVPSPEPPSLMGRMLLAVRDDVWRLVMVRHTWPAVALASTVALGFYFATYLLAARAVGVTASAVTLLPVVLLVFLAAALPLSLAGWGPREGMAAWSFGAAGLGAEQGVASAVAFAAIVLVANLPGAVVLVVASARRHRARPVPAPLPEEPQLVERGGTHG